MTVAADLRFLTTPDGDLAYRDTGSGPALVLLHGGFLDHRMWDDQVSALAATHRVVVPDARGHGASANATRPFRPADDVAALLGHLGIDSAVLAGLSMGGGVAVDTALEHPGLVRALIVSGAGTSEPDFQDPWTTSVLADWNRALAAGDVDAWVEAFLRFVPGPHRTADDVDPALLRRQRDMALGTIRKHTAGEPDHRIPVPDTRERLAGIGVPVLAVRGGLDSEDHLRMADRLVRGVPHGRTVTVEDTAHYPNMERPDVFNALVAGFLAAL
ncbi:alpha/beta hydrolase [Streptomyces sp. NRRL F-4711]|uniref:alpha/beta fold hydrolase n=1 Tax=unclassified Streptomyces TaxID=2593676 RepID=UPI0004C1E4A0|nr:MULTISPECIES: alpha/beta fold hydrolase [unclassified Streptomyces]KOT94916.1 alpha/beta hydrolase [Streptomyces sp. NRRL F-4711]